jgi:hypothetical protein
LDISLKKQKVIVSMMTAAATDFLSLKAGENELFQQVQILKSQCIVVYSSV